MPEQRPSSRPETFPPHYSDVCEVCNAPAAVGFGSPPTWYCAEHFDQALGTAMQTIRNAAKGSDR